MRIAIIGSNGQVGRELSIMLDSRGHDVVRIVRNKFSGSFFEHHGLDYRIADMLDLRDASASLAGADSVVIAARDKSDPPSLARSRNSQLIKNAVSESPDECNVIFFSTIMTFGAKVYADVPERSTLSRYRINKLFSEALLHFQGWRYGKQYYSLRLGHVFGNNQQRAISIRRFLERGNSKHLIRCDPERASNVLHTVTLAEAVEQCSRGQYPSGTYSLVNTPQWSWAELFEFYNQNGNIRYTPQEVPEVQSSTITSAVKKIFKLGKRVDLNAFAPFFPDSLNRYLYGKSKIANARREINELEERRGRYNALYMPIFGYDEIPGPFLDELSSTHELIKSGSFSAKRFFD